jgi:hypothetical protein
MLHRTRRVAVGLKRVQKLVQHHQPRKQEKMTTGREDSKSIADGQIICPTACHN